MPPAPEAQQHFAGPGFGNVGGFDAQVFLGVNAAGKHGVVLDSPCAAIAALSQPVEKRLYAWFRCRCIAARAPAASCAAIALQHGAVLGHRGAPQRRRIVVVLELLVERPGALLPQHLDHGDQRAVAGGLGDAHVEEPVAGERLVLACVELPCASASSASSIAATCAFLRRLGGERRAFALDHVARAQQLERARRRLGVRAAPGLRSVGA